MSQDLFDGTQGSHGEQGPVRQTAVSPVRPTSEAISDAYLDLSGPPFSSTPANQQRVSGARPFSSPSPVPSASRSYKRTRLDDSSRSEASMRLYMNASADSSNPYDIPDDGAQGPAGDFSGSQVWRGGPPGLPATCTQGPGGPVRPGMRCGCCGACGSHNRGQG